MGVLILNLSCVCGACVCVCMCVLMCMRTNTCIPHHTYEIRGQLHVIPHFPVVLRQVFLLHTSSKLAFELPVLLLSLPQLSREALVYRHLHYMSSFYIG